MLHTKGANLVEQFYAPLWELVPDLFHIQHAVTNSITPMEKEYLTESLYTIDVQVFHLLLRKIAEKNIQWRSKYSDYSILGIF